MVVCCSVGQVSAEYTDRDLFKLASEGDAAGVKKALAAGARPDGYLNPRGTSALAKTVIRSDENTDIAGLLLDAGADINLKGKVISQLRGQRRGMTVSLSPIGGHGHMAIVFI